MIWGSKVNCSDMFCRVLPVLAPNVGLALSGYARHRMYGVALNIILDKDYRTFSLRTGERFLLGFCNLLISSKNDCHLRSFGVGRQKKSTV